MTWISPHGGGNGTSLPLVAGVAGSRVDPPGSSAGSRLEQYVVGVRAVNAPRERTGVWAGPGILALVDGVWHHWLPSDAPRDLTARAVPLVGTDRPRITITLGKDVGDDAQAPRDRP